MLPQVTYPAAYGYGRGFRVTKNGNYNVYGLTLSPGVTVNQSTGNTLVFAAMNNFISGGDGTFARGEFVGSGVPMFHIHNTGEIRPLFNWPGTIAKVPVSTVASPVPFTVAQTRTGSATANIKYWINGAAAPLQTPGSSYGSGLGGTVTQISSNGGNGGIAGDFVYVAFFDGKAFTDQEIAGLHNSLTGNNAFSLITDGALPATIGNGQSAQAQSSVSGGISAVTLGSDFGNAAATQSSTSTSSTLSAVAANALQINNNPGQPESAINFGSAGFALVVGNSAGDPGASIVFASNNAILQDGTSTQQESSSATGITTPAPATIGSATSTQQSTSLASDATIQSPATLGNAASAQQSTSSPEGIATQYSLDSANSMMARQSSGGAISASDVGFASLGDSAASTGLMAESTPVTDKCTSRLRQDRINEKIWQGRGKAASVLGACFDVYRPTEYLPGLSNRVFRLKAVMNNQDNNYTHPGSIRSPFWNADMDGRWTMPGDYLVSVKNPDNIYFILAQDPLLPIPVVECNTRVKISRKLLNAGFGRQAYGGACSGNSVDITGHDEIGRAFWPASVMFGGGQGTQSSLPAGVKTDGWVILLPSSLKVFVRPADIIESEAGTRMAVHQAEIQGTGHRIRAAEVAA